MQASRSSHSLSCQQTLGTLVSVLFDTLVLRYPTKYAPLPKARQDIANEAVMRESEGGGSVDYLVGTSFAA